nr:ParA family protein [Cryptosporangium aurantiacum]
MAVAGEQAGGDGGSVVRPSEGGFPGGARDGRGPGGGLDAEQPDDFAGVGGEARECTGAGDGSDVAGPTTAAGSGEEARPRLRAVGPDEGLSVEDGRLEIVVSPTLDDLLGTTPSERRVGELSEGISDSLRDLIHRVVGRAEVSDVGAVPSGSAGAILAEVPPFERGAATAASADTAEPLGSASPESGTEQVQEIDVSDPAQSAPHALTNEADESQRRIRAVLDDATAVPRETAPDPYEVSRETDPLTMDPRVLPGDVSRETEDDDLPIAIEARRAVQVLNPGHNTLPRPATRRVMCVANQKGGVGKTTTTVNIAVALALHGNRVMVIDLDPQGNASTGLNVDHRAGVPSTYDVLVDGIPLADATVAVEGVPNLYCVPATIDLAGAEIELVSVVARENRLRRAIDAFPADIDYIFIDCPPSLGLLTVNALVAAREVLIPIQCEYYALEGLGQLLRNVELVKAHLNNDVQITTILLTMYDGRTKLADQVAAEVRGHFGETVLEAVIPRSVRVSEAPGFGQSVITYDPGSRGSTSYLQAAREIAERGARGGHQ